MLTIIRVVILSVALFICSANAQEFQGVATYKTSRAMDIKLDSTRVNSEMQKQIQAMMQKQFQKTFNLSFNREASIYKEDEALAPPSVGGSGIQVMVIGDGGGGDILYKNTKENRFSNKTDIYGKVFLVKDELKPLDWKLESETKFIGNYECRKATFTREVEVIKSSTFENSEDDSKDGELQREKQTQTITAWYTTQIPINNGPEKYHGLPGLILEVNTGKQQIVCTKITLNPDKKVEIIEPTKGKKINQKEFQAVMEKKQKEMMEQFRPAKGNRGSGDSFEIRIGG